MIKKQKTVIHNIALAAIHPGLSGGDVCLIELVKIWSKNENVDNIIYSSEVGIKVYKSFINNCKNVRFCNIGSNILYRPEIRRDFSTLKKYIGILISQLYKTVLSLFYVKRFEKDSLNIIFSHSDFWPTIIFSYLLKKRNSKAMWVVFNHMMAPNPFKGYKYQYIEGKYKLPSLIDIHHWLNQKLFFLLIRKSDLAVINNSLYLKPFRKYCRNILLTNYYAGMIKKQYLSKLKKINYKEKKYDFCYLGRFHEQKGIFEIIDIFTRIQKISSKLYRCVLIGDYKNNVGDLFVNLIKKKKISKYFHLAGFKSGLEKYKILNNSKLLLLPSYYESFGMVYVEAISMGIPVFEYDLPCYNMHNYGVEKVPYLNNDVFAKKLVDILNNRDAYNNLSLRGKWYSQNFSWEKTAKIIFGKFLDYENKS